MPLLAKDKGGDYEPLSAGMHHAVCYGVVDLGTQPSTNPQFNSTRKVAFLFEVPGERVKFEKDGVKKDLPRGISSMYTLSLNSKSKLRPALESWRGRPFTQEELDGFDLKNVLAANCFLNVVHSTKGDKTYANVASINPLAKGMNKLKPENATLFFSLDDVPAGEEIKVPAEVPDWLKGKIMQSEECVKEQQRSGAPQPTEEQMANQAEQNLDEDIPF